MGSRQVASEDSLAKRIELLLLGYTLCKNCNGLQKLADDVPCAPCEGTGRQFACLHCHDTGYDPDDYIESNNGPEPIGCTACRDRYEEDY